MFEWHALATWARRYGMIAAFCLSLLAFAFAPAVLDESYDWVRHTTSEAGGQGVEGAWLARTGFLLFGLGVGLLTFGRHRPWSLLTRVFHGFFAACMVSVATYSARSWDAPPADDFEDLLHSVAATAMGFSFAFGVLSAAWERRDQGVRAVDVVAASASVVLPLGMATWASHGGLLQRMMFLIAYAWYGREAWWSVPTLHIAEAGDED